MAIIHRGFHLVKSNAHHMVGASCLFGSSSHLLSLGLETSLSFLLPLISHIKL
ncbi:hypothetical protein BCR42DRAFT_426579 [Absidia repens]|uniref:Uncharacterized protein n=1 Tax=Absidia repens TaxID=90262 RepID=A0A1X2I246_9FUNG|nr:hypothetical protein BCR42DRAFT_426579 [Absidia repens]